MHYFVHYERASGRLTGFIKASNADFLPNPPSAAHALVEVTDAGEIAAIDSMSPQQSRLHGEVVDGKLRGLSVAALPRLRVTAEKTQLAGDGKDTTTLEVQAVDAAGQPLNDIDDELRVTTERGKLSASGGLVKLVRGQARLQLTSVNETVHRVRIRAVSLHDRVAAGTASVEFV